MPYTRVSPYQATQGTVCAFTPPLDFILSRTPSASELRPACGVAHVHFTLTFLVRDAFPDSMSKRRTLLPLLIFSFLLFP